MVKNPGTKEGRSKGGKKSCRIQQEASKNGIVSGFVVRKEVNFPKYTEDLAEAVGVILGDGTISRFQVSIAMSALVDREYSDFLVKLFEKLFCVEMVRQKIRQNTIRLTLSSRALVEWFVKMGLKVGDKIKNGVKIPDWIVANDQYLEACLRGLFDTDGCIFNHHHFVGGHEYNHMGWEFRNFNENFLDVIYNFLLKKEFRAKLGSGRVNLYNREDIERYFKEIGSSNPKHLVKFKKYFSEIRRGTKVAEPVRLESV